MGNLTYIFSSEKSGRPLYRGQLHKLRTEDNACVVFDGCKVVFASETERFSKVKHDFKRPTYALKAFKAHSTIEGAEDVTEIGRICESNSNHENHIYECFYQSGFKEAAVIVNDGCGTEEDCITLAYMQEGCEPVILKKFAESGSPCAAYATASEEIFHAENTEGKLMGLSAYGSDNSKAYISWDSENELISADIDLLEKDIDELDLSDVMNAKDVAFTLQKNFEDVMVQVAKNLKELLDERGIETENLCMAGGGVLNCPTNSKIIALHLFKNCYASPQPCDGCAESVGRGLKDLQKNGVKLTSQRLTSSYLGATYPATEIDFPHEMMRSPMAGLCDHLKSGGIIAWCQGGAEYGPRALGHRSFLASPKEKGTLDALNKIKGREAWRPLAPVVPEELFNRVFDVENTDMCEFMLRTLTIPEKWRPRLQAVCHADGSTRPQLLKREVNPQLYALLMKHFEETGIPCLVNTSLNINGFPIVETPEDLCDLAEEIGFMKEIPSVKTVFVENNDFYEVTVPYTPEGEYENYDFKRERRCKQV